MEGTASAYDWVFYFQSKIPLRLWASIAWSYTLLLKPPVLMCFAPCFIDKSKVRHTLFTSIRDKQSSKPHQATQSQFPVSGPTSHLKMTRPPGFFYFYFFYLFIFLKFFLETKVEKRWCTNSKMHCGG